jgi:hypothetical protein
MASSVCSLVIVMPVFSTAFCQGRAEVPFFNPFLACGEEKIKKISFLLNLFTTNLPQERPPARQLPTRNFSKIHHKKPSREKNPNRI